MLETFEVTKMRVLVSMLLIILCMGGANASEWQTTGTDIAGLFDQLRNGSTSSEAASKLIKLGREDRTVRQYISEHLPALIEASGGDIKTNAIRIAASLKVETAVPALVAMLRYFSLAGRTDMGATMQMENDPAGKALVQIGEPSVGPVAQVLEQGNRQARWRAALILMSIGTPAAIRAVRSHISKENDPHLRPFMEGLFKRERAPKGVGKAVLDLTAPTPKGEQLTSLAGAHAGVIGGVGLVPRPCRLPRVAHTSRCGRCVRSTSNRAGFCAAAGQPSSSRRAHGIMRHVRHPWNYACFGHIALVQV